MSQFEEDVAKICKNMEKIAEFGKNMEKKNHAEFIKNMEKLNGLRDQKDSNSAQKNS